MGPKVEHSCENVDGCESREEGKLWLSFDCGLKVVLSKNCVRQVFQAITDDCLRRHAEKDGVTIPGGAMSGIIERMGGK